MRTDRHLDEWEQDQLNKRMKSIKAFKDALPPKSEGMGIETEGFDCYLCLNPVGDDDYMVTGDDQCVCNACADGMVDHAVKWDGCDAQENKLLTSIDWGKLQFRRFDSIPPVDK